MRSLAILLLVSLLPISSATAAEDDECYLNHLVVDQTVLWNFAEDQHLDVVLPTNHRYQGLIPTPAAGHFHWNQRAGLTSLFDFETPLMSLPYNLYRLDFTVGHESDPDRYEHTSDFTMGCTEPGISFYPGRRVEITPTTVPARRDGQPRFAEPVRVRIWGVLR